MIESLIKYPKNITLPKEDYLKLLQIYKELEKILVFPKKKKSTSSLKTLYGIWKGIKINENDFEMAKKSLFKNSL